MQPIIPPNEVFIDLHFPAAGLDTGSAFWDQPNRPVSPQGDYARSTREGINVRGYEPMFNRVRGGSRPGLVRYISTPVVAGWIVQELNMLTITDGTPVQTSPSGRVVTLVAVSQGNVYYAVAGATTWTLATNNSASTPPLNFSGLMQSSPLNQKLWFADGVHARYYDAATNTVETWTASAGTLPIDADLNRPTLIATWRGRIIQSGLLLDPQNIFMSAVGDPRDWDYSPASITPTQAVALNVAPTGIVGDVITGIIPYTDDLLIILTDHQIHILRGDPMAGGQIDLVSDAIGGAFGQAWCKDPAGNVYFVSNTTGIFSMVPGQQPIRISQAINQVLQDINTGTHTFRLIWNDRFQGVHVFASTTAAPPVSLAYDTHLFWEQRSGAWWIDRYSNPNHNPLCCVTFDGNLPTDRTALIGSWDGYVRAVDHQATDDDGYNIESRVAIGPLDTKDLDEIMYKDHQTVLGDTSGEVNYAVYVGRSAEAALNNTPVSTGTFAAGRNYTKPVRRAGHALYLVISSTNAWALEQIRVLISTKGKVRRRGR